MIRRRTDATHEVSALLKVPGCHAVLEQAGVGLMAADRDVTIGRAPCN